MDKRIFSGGIEFHIHESNGFTIGMPMNSIDEHIKKHPDIATTPEGYLERAAEVLNHGKPYHDGKLYHGIFARGYNSQEIGCFVVNTIHRRYGPQTIV